MGPARTAADVTVEPHSFCGSEKMVVEVIYHRDDTMLSMSPRRDDEEEDREERVAESSMASQHRMYDMGRDTSHTNRNNGDDTRQSIHNSILNCTGETEDEDEEIEEPGSFLFDEDFHSPLNQSLDHSFTEDAALVTASSPTSPPSQQKALCCVNDKWLDTSLQNVTDSFVSLCSSRPDEACAFSDFVNAPCSRQLQHQVEFDLLQLLGCDVPSRSATMKDGTIWFASPLLIKASSNNSSTRAPVVRRNPRQRAERIRRMRNELLGTAQRHVITPTRSVDDHPLERFIGRGIDPIEQQEEDGYDSDPGQVLREHSPVSEQHSLRDTSLLDEEENEEEYHFYDGHRERIAEEYTMRMQHRGPRDEYDREMYEAVQVRSNV